MLQHNSESYSNNYVIATSHSLLAMTELAPSLKSQALLVRPFNLHSYPTQNVLADLGNVPRSGF
jgi:hypothetical protein